MVLGLLVGEVDVSCLDKVILFLVAEAELEPITRGSKLEIMFCNPKLPGSIGAAEEEIERAVQVGPLPPPSG